MIVLQYLKDMKKRLSITGKPFMKARVISLLGLTLLMGVSSASAQSFKDMFKNAKKKVEQQVKQKTSENLPKSQTTTKATTKSSSKRKGAALSAKSSGSTVNLPATHTALFAPIGAPVNAKYGIKTVKAVKPPKEETKQPDYNDARISTYELDNKSLVEEYKLLHELFENKYFRVTSPVAQRYFRVEEELNDRTKALNKMVSMYNEAKDTYGEEEQAFCDAANRNFAGYLKTRAYKTVIRSSLAPLFALSNEWIDSETRAYFKAHGGYENAHKATWTVWNPDK